MPQKSIVYTSYAVPGLQPGEMQDILVMSRANNARDAITGLLLFNGAAFVQAIEGPGEAVDRLYGRLVNDRRHFQITLHDERDCANRIFADWTMGYVEIDGQFEGQYDVADALARDMPEHIRALMMSMATTLPFE